MDELDTHGRLPTIWAAFGALRDREGNCSNAWATSQPRVPVTGSMPRSFPRHVRHLLAQVIGVHVGVALRGGDTGVAQQLLHRPQVGPRAQLARTL